MKAEWIKRSGAENLVVFFCGFASDASLLSGLRIPADCDLLAFFDYRNFDIPDFDLSGYGRVGVVAWSFGVWVADYFFDILPKPVARIAVAGSPWPVDDKLGIPREYFRRTLENFGPESPEKFMRRICGGTRGLAENSALLSSRGFEELRDELKFLGKSFDSISLAKRHWDCCFASRSDKIFPLPALEAAWGNKLRVLDGAHLNIPLFDAAIDALSGAFSKIGEVFGRKSGDYEKNAFVQKCVSEKLAMLTCHFASQSLGCAPRRILEIGCGTGFLTELLFKKYPEAEWTINDANFQMCAIASAKCGFRPFQVHADASLCNFDGLYDIIVSSSCFQWIDDLRALFLKLSKLSRVGALLAFSTYGESNFRQIRELTGRGLSYRGIGELKALLSGAGFSVLHASEDNIDAVFSSPREVLAHIKATGVNGAFASFWTPRKARDFYKKYSGKYSCENGVVLSYNPVYIIAKRKEF